MRTEYDENELDYWKLPSRNYIVKMKKTTVQMMVVILKVIKNTLPAHLGDFILSNTKRVMNNFIRKIDGFYNNNNIYYSNNDSLHIERKYREASDKANLVGKHICQGKNDYETGGSFHGLLLAPKINFVQL